MDKLMDSNLFMKIVALSLAILLFITVNFDSPNKKGLDEGATSKSNSEVIENVPVTIIYDEENLVVSGVPETVDVSIDGPNAIVQTTKTLRNFEVFVDLTDEQIGEKRVPIQIREISDKLNVTIDPAFAQVSIEERVTKEFIVEAEYNQTMIEDGYYAELPTVEPNKVQVTGAKNVIEQISYVKATIDDRGKINQTTTREATVLVLDQALNKLPVIVEPETVLVTIPVKRSIKTVPIEVIEKGSLPRGVTLQSIDLEVEEIDVIANQEHLNSIDNVKIEVDLSRVRNNTELEVPIIVPENALQVDPEKITVTINVVVEEEINLKNIPITPTGLRPNLAVNFNDPSDGLMSITVIGPPEIVNNLSKDDFAMTIDTNNLDEGDYDLKVNVNGPPDVRWTLRDEIVNISLVEE